MAKTNPVKLSYRKARLIREEYVKLTEKHTHSTATHILAAQFEVHRRSIDRVVMNDAWVLPGTPAVRV